MADNVAVTAGTGTTIAADEVVDGTLGTVKVQYVKLMDGTLDATTKISPATSGKQDTGNTSLASIDGKITAVNTGAVVVSSSALPSGASTAAKQPALGTAGTPSADVITVQGVTSMTALKVDGSAVTQPVSGTVTATIAAGATTIAKAEDVASADADTGVPAMAVRKATPANTSGTDGDYEMLQMSAGRLWVDASGKTLTVDGSGVTQPVSAASLPLPSGASTAAKQPALGTAGTASADVITVQGIASMTALKVDGSAVTQPVSGTITANAGTGTMAVSLASVPSHAVTNAGTFATQSAITYAAANSGGYTPGKLVSAATTNATSVQGSATTVGWITASNVNAAARYLKIYNKATAPTVGTDTPVQTFIIPGNTAGAGTNIPLPPQGMALGTGFAFALTTEATDAGTTAVAANEIVVNYGYK